MVVVIVIVHTRSTTNVITAPVAVVDRSRHVIEEADRRFREMAQPGLLVTDRNQSFRSAIMAILRQKLVSFYPRKRDQVGIDCASQEDRDNPLFLSGQRRPLATTLYTL